MKKKLILIFFLLVIWVVIGFIIYGFVKNYLGNKNSGKSYDVKESITIESGEALPLVKDYFEGDYPEDATLKYYHRDVDITERENYFYYKKDPLKISMGVFKLEVEIVGNVTYKSMLIIKDETAPEIKLKKITVKSYTDYAAKDFVDEYNDNSGVSEYVATFLEEPSQEVGEHTVNIKVCDNSENCVEDKTTVNIIPGDITIGQYKLEYGKYVGEVCDEGAISHCETSEIYVLGNKIQLNDGSLKKYIVDGNNLILSNTEVFKIVGDNTLEYQNNLKPIYKFVGES